MTPLRILIGCETSGIARRAFSALGVAKSVCYARPAPHNRSDNYGYSY